MLFSFWQNIINNLLGVEWLCKINVQEGYDFQKLQDQKPLIPGFNHLTFRTSKKLHSGWYLFSIHHSGINQRAFGILSSPKTYFCQGRPMYPGKKRLRVLHIKKKSYLYLDLVDITDPVYIKSLSIKKIDQFSAWRRIRKRCRKLLGENICSLSRGQLWRLYNKAQLAQRFTSPLFSYSSWRKNVEKKLRATIQTYIPYPECFVYNIDSAPILPIDRSGYVIPVFTGDQLSHYHRHAISLVLKSHPNFKIFYADDDVVSNSGVRMYPSFRPSWNTDLFWSSLSFAHFWCFDTKVWNSAIRSLLRYSTNFSFERLLLEIQFIVHQTYGKECIVHLPLILYHVSDERNSYLHSCSYCDHRHRALNDFCVQHQLKSNLFDQVFKVDSQSTGYRLSWLCPKNTLVSIIIPTKDCVDLLQQCIDSLYQYSSGVEFEIIIVDNGSSNHETLKYLDSFVLQSGRNGYGRHYVHKNNGPFNYSQLNNQAVQFCNGDVLLLLNNDTQILADGWGKELAANALRPGIGCVGAKLVYPDNTIQHAGVVLGIGGVAGHAFKYLDRHAPGYLNRAQLQQEYSAVTAACLAISRKNWQILEGMNENDLHVNYNDVDLCLRAHQVGLSNIYLPHVELIHYESKTRGRPQGKAYSQWRKEFNYMSRKWGNFLLNDPYYHPSLSLDSESWDFSLLNYQLRAR